MQTNMLYYKGDNIPLPLPNIPKIISKTPINSSKYVKLQQIKFKELGNTKVWDVSNSLDSVAILLYDKEQDGFIFVRQFRVSVFLKNPNHGFMYELCAGLCDKNINIKEIAVQEIQEECGYHITSDRLYSIAQFYNNVGMNGALQNLFYAQISKKDKKSNGGGNIQEGENIELIFVPRKLINIFLNDNKYPKTQSLAYSILWFQMQNNVF